MKVLHLHINCDNCNLCKNINQLEDLIQDKFSNRNLFDFKTIHQKDELLNQLKRAIEISIQQKQTEKRHIYECNERKPLSNYQ